MRLYLSSFRQGLYSEKLISLVRDGRQALIIMNACDGLSSHQRAQRLEAETDELRKLGFNSTELDLRHYFSNSNKQKALENLLRSTDLVWVRGGNIFILLRALKYSGMDYVLPKLIREDAFAYGGYSAGIDILTYNIHGTELVDDPNEIPKGYDQDIIWNGIGLIPFAIAPHYQSDHPESESIEKLVQYYIANHIPFVALRDGEVIIQEPEGPLVVLGLNSQLTSLTFKAS